MNTNWPLPFWVAHRGAGKLAPENTLAAFRLGASFGYTAFECDVKLSADDVPYLLHDASLDRTTSGHGNAQNLTWRELSSLDAGAWHSEAFQGVTLAKLEEIVAFCHEGKLALNLEIKPIPGQEAHTGTLVAKAVTQWWKACDLPAPLLTSFKTEALEAARQAAPSLLRGLLIEQYDDAQVAVARDLGCSALVCNYRSLDAAGIEVIHRAGMKALCYTVNDADSADRLVKAGIDGLITDAVDKFKPGAPG